MPNAAVRLLVVDDNADNRDVLARRLRRLGHDAVDMAEDGQMALDAVVAAAATSAPYDAVLLDVMMPRMSGVEVLERLAADAALRQTPVIMISAATEIETVVRCIELGAEDYLQKPCNPVLLRARLGTVLEKKRLRDEVARQFARMEEELAEARRQQLSMLPDAFPAPDPANPVTVHAVMHPAREVGGDLYDCFEAAPGVLAIAVGDVSGKGVPAALFMARARSLLRASALQHAAATGRPPRPSELVAVLNEELCKNNPTGMFVTLFVGFLDCATGRLDFVNAGHVRPFHLVPAAAPAEVPVRCGLPPGMMEDRGYTDAAMTLGAGEALVIITDGLPEMADPDGAFYTTERIAADLAALADADPATITTTLAANARAFAAGAPAADDVTVMAVRRGG
ncbi:MAG TPA: SpoIIE family protein phosphatase [Acetobacteraceae bacterium]|nr:SpoIIE family protein phosphatase [Acetobacteraceae bacterium]